VARPGPDPAAASVAEMSSSLVAAATRLQRVALALPEAWEDHPWDERVVKVGKKIFLFLTKEDDLDERLHVGVKLPESAEEALTFDFTEPTGYGLGRAGWVSARFAPGDRPPVDILCDWADESYRAIAPKTLVRRLDESAQP
jgi:predicted DNA-binding protein (MmcQ/YjbR family)